MEFMAILSAATHRLAEILRSANILGVIICICTIGAVRTILGTRKRYTKLQGPSSTSLLFGVGKDILDSPDPSAVYEGWQKQYGAAYEIPMALGKRRVVLHDPKALAHVFNKDMWTYVHTALHKTSLEKTVGKGIMTSDGEIHRRHRRALAPAISSAVVRDMAPILYHSAYKVESAWEAFIDAGGGGSAIVEVQDWMNHMSLDVIGRACFSHDFGSLDGKKNAINSVLQTFSSISKDHTSFILLLQRFPFLLTVPTPRNGLAMDLHRATAEIADSLLAKIKKEKEEGHLEGKEQSSLSFLLKSEDAQNNVYLTRAEVLAQMKVLLLAGYETTAITMTWALLELARNPDIQKKLRSELLSFGVEPTYDELSKNLPYLDAVVHEILRLHPAVPELTRQLKEDDIIPLSGPVRTKTGETVNDIILARGNVVVIPIPSVNRSEAIWGFDAKVFKPERWLDAEGVTQNAYEVPGHRHLLTFGEGTKHCLGKYFAIAEIKIVLSVLVKNFVLEMRDGPGTKIEMGLGMLPRPKLAGEDSIKMPLRVRRYEG